MLHFFSKVPIFWKKFQSYLIFYCILFQVLKFMKKILEVWKKTSFVSEDTFCPPAEAPPKSGKDVTKISKMKPPYRGLTKISQRKPPGRPHSGLWRSLKWAKPNPPWSALSKLVDFLNPRDWRLIINPLHKLKPIT